jgi:sugar lactone lactonase YvrE
MTSSANPELVLPARAELGEGPFWCDGDLLWIDAARGRLHRTEVATGRDDVAHYGCELGVVVPTDSPDRYLATTEHGLARIEAGRMEVIDPVASDPGLFMNDGKCDPLGRLWSSVNGRGDAPGRGSLHVWEPGRPSRRVDDGFTLLNGIGWSPDGSVMYVADSVTRQIFAYDYHVESATVDNRRVLCAFTESDGMPDGLAVDVHGYLWVAFYGGWCLRRVDRRGRVTAHFRMPVSRPTSCAFGDGSALYITSAREGLGPDRLRDEPLAGSVWRIDAGVCGAPVAAARWPSP